MSSSASTMATQIRLRTSDGQRFNLHVEVSETVAVVHMRISNHTGIAPDQMRLNFAGIRMEDERLLSDYGIQNESTVRVEVQIQVFVQTLTGQMLGLMLWPSNTIEEVRYIVRHYEWIPPDNQRLTFADRDLRDENSLDGEGIKAGDTLVHVRM